MDGRADYLLLVVPLKKVYDLIQVLRSGMVIPQITLVALIRYSGFVRVRLEMEVYK